jgi:GT2 family glycosyltransferase
VATVAVIVVNWNTRVAGRMWIRSRNRGDLDCEAVVVDNGSSDGSPAMVRERRPVRLMANPTISASPC